ncbi:hypothetical protein E3P99_03457 [Wallemia hederae]|uniref:Conserved oligomeric Golgi complex subunit 4 n=1 Tax=Wallemia hederae TaxID=1540922 RepID=A0A4T0FHQ8_9BASI|nr:hypothetical protein E3P99_03457 [Wallemia hederae]
MEIEIKNKLNSLDSAESALDALIASQSAHSTPLDLTDLDKLTRRLAAFKSSLSGKLVNTGDFYSTLSALDTQQHRLAASLDMVRKTQLLQSSLRLLDMAIDERDYDQASVHAQRALNIPQSITTSEFADTVVPSTHHPEPPLQRLDNSLDTLNEIFIKHFNTASENLNQAEISRFFKLFPKINRKLDGITAYSQFVVRLIQRKFKGSLDSLASLRVLLDNMANVVEDHQPVVNKYYGEEYMATVLQSLLGELDNKAALVFGNWSRNVSAIDKADLKQVNSVVSELSGLASHFAAFKLFMTSSLPTAATSDLLDSSATARLLHEHTNDTYINLELAYFRSSMKQVLEGSEVDEDATPYTSSVLDDTFYVYKGVLDRLVGCGDAKVLGKAVDGFIKIFQQCYIDRMQMDFDNIIKPRTSKMIAQQSKAVSGAGSSNARKVLKVSVCLNNLDICAEYNLRILSDVASEGSLRRYFDEEDVAAVADELKTLKKVSDDSQTSLSVSAAPSHTHTSHTSQSCLDTLFATTFKNAVKDCLKSAMNVTNYAHDADAQSTLFVVIFEREWSALFDQWMNSLTTNNFDEVFIKSTTHLIQLWENMVFNSRTSKFSVSGAMQFEKDVHDLLTYLSGLSNVGIRELFSRIRQMSSVLNEQGTSNSGHYWKLSASEISSLQNMKVSEVY